jgi:YesN/AraC family two-component response regulator
MHFADKMRTSQDDNSKDSLAVAVLKYIDAKYKDATLTEFAAMQNYDMAWVSKEIKRQIGKTFKELLHEKRMSLATYLLVHTKISIAELMEIIGYENSSFFHKKFKGRYGMSPKEYRQNSEKREKR